jgi:hypothetical protein
MCLGPYVLEGPEGFVALARSSSWLLLREGERNGEPEIVTVDKSGANLAALVGCIPRKTDQAISDYWIRQSKSVN